MLPVVEGACLASVQKFAEAVQERFELSGQQRDQVTTVAAPPAILSPVAESMMAAGER